jgi:putative FmdB family regulatory protein
MPSVPVYEFRCADCNQFFDRLLSFDAVEPACPACSGTNVRRLISLIGGLHGSTERVGASSGGCACGGACSCSN